MDAGEGEAAVSLNQYRIAMIAEMIHVASLVHDDVIDEADTRRGNATVNAVWGNKMVSEPGWCSLRGGRVGTVGLIRCLLACILGFVLCI